MALEDDIKTSRIPGFKDMSVDERVDIVRNFSALDDRDVSLIDSSFSAFWTREQADKFTENCICGNPLTGIISNACIDGEDYLIPASAEEPSIIAAASRAFKLARPEGFKTESISNLMAGQVYVSFDSPASAEQGLAAVQPYFDELIDIANLGREHTRAEYILCDCPGDYFVLQPFVYTKDVQGANVVNEMCAAMAPRVSELSGGEVLTGILSNYADQCMARAVLRLDIGRLRRRYRHQGTGEVHVIPAEVVLPRFLRLAEFAEEDVYRATTHNKGIMNGVVAVANATGQDTRALEAGAHAYASRSGKYSSLSHWYQDGDQLVGELEMPVPVGTVRGATGLPYAGLGLKILGNPKATWLQQILVATGLANNFSAIQTLVTDGINRGHLALHDKRFAERASGD